MVVQELMTRLGFTVDSGGIEKAKSSLSGFQKWMGGLALGAGVLMIGRAAIKTAMDVQSLNAQFAVMTGSQERGAALMAEISKYAAETPYEKLGLSSAAKTLLNFNVTADNIIPTLRMLGDVAGPSQEKLASLALVYGQVQSTGKLMGQDLLQLINVGFNPLTVISKKSGKSVAELKQIMEQGGISAQMVTDAFKIATSEGGIYFNNLKVQAKQTLGGLMSTVKDNVMTGLAESVAAFFPTFQAVAQSLSAIDWSPLVEAFASIGEGITTNGDAITAFFNGAVKLVALGVKLGGVALKLALSIGKVFEIAKLLAPVLILVFGPIMIARIVAVTAAIQASGFAQMFFQRACLAGGAAAGYQLTALGLLKAGYYTLATAAKTAAASIKTAMLASVNPLTAVLALLASIYYFKTKVDEAERKAQVRMDANAARDAAELAMNEALKEEALLKDMRTQMENTRRKHGTIQEISAYEKAIHAQEAVVAQKGKMQQAAYATMNDYIARETASENGNGDAANAAFEASMKTADAYARRIAAGNAKHVEIKQDTKFQFDIKGDAKAGTGLTASQVAELAGQAIRAEFNLQLKNLTVAALS